MQQKVWNAVDQYLCDKLVPADPALDAALVANAASDLPAIDVSPNQGKLLYLLALLRGARRILELGTLGGYSTIWLARALPAGGHLTTLELDPKHAQVAGRNIARAGFAQMVEIRVGPALQSLAQLDQEKVEPFDLVFMDADKDNYPGYLTGVMKLAKKGTLIVADNIVRNGAVADPDTRDPRVQGVRTFFDMIAADSRLEATAIQTVGSKNYDGFAIALVIGD